MILYSWFEPRNSQILSDTKPTMENPTEINSVYWDEETKSWQYKIVPVEEYHGFTECQHCRRPMSHNIKSEGEFKVVYTKCGCSR